MPRYVIERTFPTGLGIPANPAGAVECRNVVDLQRGGGRHLCGVDT